MQHRQISSLHFAVRPRVLLKYGGQLLVVFSLLTSVTFFVSLLAGEYLLSWIYGTIIATTGLSGFLLQRMEAPVNLQNNEVLTLSAAVFIIIPLIASIPFQQAGLGFSDAIFEAVSAVTTTGLSTLPTVQDYPKTFLFSRAWLQWVGGLGIVVLGVAILLPQSPAALRLFSGNWQKENVVTSTKAYARAVLMVYIVLTVLGVGALLLQGGERFSAVCHILAAVSTGGFSTFDNSLAGFSQGQLRTTIIFFCFLGAMPLGLYYQSLSSGVGRFFANIEVIGLISASLGASLLLSLLLYQLDGFSIQEALQSGPLLAISAQTTAGFAGLTVADLSNGSKLLVIFLMAVGGNIGSTAGGIKIMRLLVIAKMIHLLFQKIGLANGAVVQPRYMGKRLEPDEIERCFLLVFLFVGVILLSWLPFVIMGYPALDALFEVVSACGTVGLSTGITSLELPTSLKGILCLDMLLGRLEIVAILLIFYPPTWYGRKKG